MQFRRQTRWMPVLGAALVLGLAGCSRNDEAAPAADSAAATPAAKVICHPSLMPMLEALPSTPLNGTAVSKRECHNGVATVKFGEVGKAGQAFSYSLTTFRLKDSGLESLGKIEGQKMLDALRKDIEAKIKVQQDKLANARQAGAAVGANLTQDQKDRLPHETRLPTGDSAIVFSDDGKHWQLIGLLPGERALEIDWTHPGKPFLRTDEAVVEVLALAAHVRYEQLTP